MNPKNTKQSAIHENVDANITCNFRDGHISRLGVGYLTHAIHTRYIHTSLAVLCIGITIDDSLSGSRPFVDLYI